MKRFIVCLASLAAFGILSVQAFGQDANKISESDMDPRETHQEYNHVIAIGANQPFSNGSNNLSPIIAYYWFGYKYKNPDLYTQFTFTTTRIFFILGYKTDRIFAGVKPQGGLDAQHVVYQVWILDVGVDDFQGLFSLHGGSLRMKGGILRPLVEGNMTMLRRADCG
ncbi:MAG: hypothetical protein MUF86_17295 [Akkermansiaceae bacterium]|nr:hypothetical protein [Akkermansiaceae bacterium]